MEIQEISKLRTELNFIKKPVERINIYRHKLMAGYAKKGKTLDVGFGNVPNQFLKNPIGIDLGKAPKPKNYSKVVVGDACNMPFENEEFDNILAGEIIVAKFQLENNGFNLIEKRGVYFGIPIISRWIPYFRHIPCRNLFISFTIIYVAEKTKMESKRVQYLKKYLEEKK